MGLAKFKRCELENKSLKELEDIKLSLVEDRKVTKVTCYKKEFRKADFILEDNYQKNLILLKSLMDPLRMKLIYSKRFSLPQFQVLNDYDSSLKTLMLDAKDYNESLNSVTCEAVSLSIKSIIDSETNISGIKTALTNPEFKKSQLFTLGESNVIKLPLVKNFVLYKFLPEYYLDSSGKIMEFNSSKENAFILEAGFRNIVMLTKYLNFIGSDGEITDDSGTIDDNQLLAGIASKNFLIFKGCKTSVIAKAFNKIKEFGEIAGQ